jgi:hypothetical protein
VRDRILLDASLPASAIRAQLQASISNVGLALAATADAGKVERLARREIVEQVDAHGHHVSALIADTVRKWDPQTITEKAESRDRQGPSVHPDQRHADRRARRPGAAHDLDLLVDSCAQLEQGTPP